MITRTSDILNKEDALSFVDYLSSKYKHNLDDVRARVSEDYITLPPDFDPHDNDIYRGLEYWELCAQFKVNMDIIDLLRKTETILSESN